MKELYKRIRKNGAIAQAAYTKAKEREAAGVEWYKIPAREVIEYNAPGDDGLRWVEHASAGLRIKGYADKLGARGIQHTGWFTDDDGTRGTLRGIVYQLPAKDGKPRYIPGYVESENYDETGGARPDFTDIRECEIEAAYAADKLAERAAEKEREYQEAWRAGNDYAEAGEELSQERKATLELIRDMKKTRSTDKHVYPSICAALQSTVRDNLRTIAQLKAKRATLIDDFSASWRADTFAAFNEGAGKEILTVK